MNTTVRPRGGEHPGPDRGALAPVLGQDDDLVGAGGRGRVGGAVARAVVDHHDLERRRRRPSRRARPGDAATESPTMRSARGTRAAPPTAGPTPGRGRVGPASACSSRMRVEQQRAVGDDSGPSRGDGERPAPWPGADPRRRPSSWRPRASWSTSDVDRAGRDRVAHEGHGLLDPANGGSPPNVMPRWSSYETAAATASGRRRRRRPARPGRAPGPGADRCRPR